jgi:hypothetical protein
VLSRHVRGSGRVGKAHLSPRQKICSRHFWRNKAGFVSDGLLPLRSSAPLPLRVRDGNPTNMRKTCRRGALERSGRSPSAPHAPHMPHVSENKFSVGERESASVKRACHGLGGAHGFILLVCRNLLYCSSGTRSLAARVDTLRIFSCALRTEEASPARCSARYCSASATVCRGESSGNERR